MYYKNIKVVFSLYDWILDILKVKKTDVEMKTDYKKKFIKYLRNTDYTKSHMRVFQDFLSLSVIHGNSLTEEKRQEFTTPAFLFNYQNFFKKKGETTYVQSEPKQLKIFI